MDGAYIEESQWYNVYAQHLDQNLEPHWDEGGVRLYTTNTYLISNSRKHHYGVLATDDGEFIIVDRRINEDHGGLYYHRFFIRKYNNEGDLSDGWPEEGIPLFENECNIQFFNEPGRGLWCYYRNGQGVAPRYQVNLIQPDGALRLKNQSFQRYKSL